MEKQERRHDAEASSAHTVLLQVHQRSEIVQRALRQAGGTSRQDRQEGEPRDALVERLRGSVLGQRL